MQDPQAIPFGEPHATRLFDYGFGRAHRVSNDKIRQVGLVERYSTQEHSFFLGPNAQGHPAVVFHCYSWHGGMYAFK
jgi:hypothetical protein